MENLTCEEGDDVCTVVYNLLKTYNRQLENLYTIYKNSHGDYTRIPFDLFLNLVGLRAAVENGIKIAQSAEDPDTEVLDGILQAFKIGDVPYLEIAGAVKSLHSPISRYFFDPTTGEINDIRSGDVEHIQHAERAPRARLSNFRNPERLAVPRAFSRNIANEANFYDDVNFYDKDWIIDYLYE